MKRCTAATLTLLVALGLTSPQAASADEQLLVLKATAGSPVGSRLTGGSVSGSASVDVNVVTLGSGLVKSVPGLNGVAAFGLPRFVDSSTPPRAVLSVTNAGRGDALAPGAKDFTFGADFNLNRVSIGSSVDNGDNVIQRGMFGNRSQYKIDADGGRISCRIKGSAGGVSVKSSVRAEPGLWYRAECARIGQRVLLSVREYLPGGGSRLYRNSARGTTGSLTWGSNSVPLAVGGKLNTKGEVVLRATDQFNGSVNRAVLTIHS